MIKVQLEAQHPVTENFSCLITGLAAKPSSQNPNPSFDTGVRGNTTSAPPTRGRHGLMGAGFLAFLALLTGGSRFFSLIRNREFEFAEAPQALEALAKGEHFGKLVIRVG